MQNLSFKPSEKTQKPCSSNFPLYVEQMDSQGRTVLVESKDPYEGLSAESFELDAQLAAGVPMTHFAPISSNSLSAIDRNNVEGEKFVNSLTPKNE